MASVNISFAFNLDEEPLECAICLEPLAPVSFLFELINYLFKITVQI